MVEVQLDLSVFLALNVVNNKIIDRSGENGSLFECISVTRASVPELLPNFNPPYPPILSGIARFTPAR